MRGLVVSRDAEFGQVLLAVIQAFEGCHGLLQTEWSLTDLESISIIIAYIGSDEDTQRARQLLLESNAHSNLRVILISQEFEPESKKLFFKLGAVDCLERPVNLQRIRYLVESSANRYRAIANRTAHTQSTQQTESSPAHSPLIETITKLGRVDSNLLITGETGVGKSYVAKLIHERSRRCKHPFVTVNCAAIPETLIESELFGHKKGSFTGADSNKVGKFAHAGKGTILLDELDALPQSSQAKLLHAVEDRIFQAVGSNEPIKFNARIIAASNQDLEELVAAGRFRSDLFFRIDVYELHIPPLRERKEELVYFSRLFANEFAEKNRNGCPTISDEVMQIVRNYAWPGNLRELRNCMEHASINCSDNTIMPQDLPPRIQKHLDRNPPQSDSCPSISSDITDKRKRTIIEIARLLKVLEQHNYNRTRAAKEMGISRAGLYKKLQRYHLS